MPQTTLAIDFGSKHIGLALVQNGTERNVPLFAGTLSYKTDQLKKKLNLRPLLRRMRRTRKTRKARLRKLQQALSSIGLKGHQVAHIVSFSKRRGWISLFSNNEVDNIETEGEEVVFRYSREEFFQALEREISATLPTDKHKAALRVCENILNRHGDPAKEIRPIRIDNRGVSRCAWQGCPKVTPRRDNAIRDALSQFVYAIIDRDSLLQDADLHDQLEDSLNSLETLAKRLRNAGGKDPLTRDPQQVKAERKVLLKRIGNELKLVKELSNDETWSTNRKNIINILDKSRGRNRYCREHSREFVKYWLEGKAVPFKASLTERDLVSRREEVLFQKLWRYIEARILPLAPEGVDRLVVERVAFDLLSGTWKQRQKVGDNRLEEMYQLGPQYGFKNRLEMLRTEFGGLCAYCGEKSDSILEQEHILPRREFTFDSYLNLVPSCPKCNRQLKSKHSPSSANLTINDKAFEAFKDYLSTEYRNKAPHHLHNIKKGILNLMTDPERSWEAEQYLALIAKNYLEVTGTQRSPRPLARYLSERLNRKYRRYPKVVFYNGRHTALWRNAAYPDFDKTMDKATGGMINHAVDALILACKLPSTTMLEWKNLPVRSLKSWAESVRKAAPEPESDGIPVMPYPNFAVPGFEEVLKGNYLSTNLSYLNWNRTNARIQRQDIYGWNHHKDMPTRRTAASDLVSKLIAADKKKTQEAKHREVLNIVDNIVHPHLRKALKKVAHKEPPGKACAEAMIEWLRKSINGSLPKATFSPHPSDQSRKRMLQDFVEGKSDTVPITIGIKMFRPHDTGAVDLSRVSKRNGKIIHRYRSDPAIVAKIVCYKKNGDSIKRNKPKVFNWRQSWELIPTTSRLQPVPLGPLRGRAFGQPLPPIKDWYAALNKYLSGNGFVEYAVVRQGTVVCYENGSEQYIRNFSSTQGFKAGMLKGIVGIRKTPFHDKVVQNTILV